MKCAAFVMAIGIVLLSLTQTSAAQSFTQVIVFGDSNVDSGFYRLLGNPGGGSTFNADWSTAVAHGAGGPTTNPGLMSVQYLAAFFGLTANPSNTAGGTNYATSGAKNETANNSVNGGFTAAIPTGTQIHNYLTPHSNIADSQALYVIWSGDNDVAFANGDTGTGPYPADPTSYVQEAAEDLVGDLLFLKNAGARHIIVAGLAYDFPMGNSVDATNKRALKLAYTQELFQNLDMILGTGFAYKAGIDQVRMAIYNSPARHGFTNIGTQPGEMACSQPSGISTAWALLCSSRPGRAVDLFGVDAADRPVRRRPAPWHRRSEADGQFSLPAHRATDWSPYPMK
jgi:outer membrane lipase/esterase